MSAGKAVLIVLGTLAGVAAFANGDDKSDSQQPMGALGGFLGALGGSLGGDHPHDPVDFHTLVSLLPASLPNMQREPPRGDANQAMGIKTTSADVNFKGPNGALINVAIKDATAFSALAGFAAMANGDESEQGDDYEKNETIGGRSVHETWRATNRHGELSLIVAQRFGVDVQGDGVAMDALKRALAGIDLGKLESMKDANSRAH